MLAASPAPSQSHGSGTRAGLGPDERDEDEDEALRDDTPNSALGVASDRSRWPPSLVGEVREEGAVEVDAVSAVVDEEDAEEIEEAASELL